VRLFRPRREMGQSVREFSEIVSASSTGRHPQMKSTFALNCAVVFDKSRQPPLTLRKMSPLSVRAKTIGMISACPTASGSRMDDGRLSPSEIWGQGPSDAFL
jgi:hypothetical protein